MRTLSLNARFRSAALIFLSCGFPFTLIAQSADSVLRKPDKTWAGKRIVTLKGFGDYFALDECQQPKLVNPEGLGVNIVAVAQRVENDRIWVKANGAGDAPVGWVGMGDAILLEDAVPYFTASIKHDPHNWDAYLRRAEAEHALNQREAAISDYTAAITLHTEEPFLYIRRGREFRILKACDKAAADFDKAIHLKPEWPEPYNLEAGVLADCPDPHYRDPGKAIALIENAIELDLQHPTYLTVLALAYARNGEFDKAVSTQKRELESPRFPPGYREEATDALKEYERALAAK